MDIKRMASEVVKKFAAQEFPEGSVKPQEFLKYSEAAAKDEEKWQKTADVTMHRVPKGGPPSPARSHLDNDEIDEDVDIQKIESDIIRVASSLDGLASGFLEELDRISKDDLKAAKDGDNMFIEEGSALEKIDEEQGGRKML